MRPYRLKGEKENEETDADGSDECGCARVLGRGCGRRGDGGVHHAKGEGKMIQKVKSV